MPNLINCRFKSLMILTFLTFASSTAFCQTTYQKLFAEVGTGNYFKSIRYCTTYDSTCLVIGNKSIIEFNMNTGAINYSKKTIMSGAELSFINAYKEGTILYIGGTFTSLGLDTACLIKYDLPTKTILWCKKIVATPTPISISRITGDGLGHLYIAGTTYETVGIDGFFSSFAFKTDTAGDPIWYKKFGASAQNEYFPSLIYKNNREIYMTSSTFYPTWAFGRTNTIRLTSDGEIILKKALTTATGPRFGACYSGLTDGMLCTVSETLLGPSDPGPILIRKLDSNLVVTTETIKSGTMPRHVFFNDSTIIINGQAPVTSGIPGFRTIRLDKNLNVTGARHFNKILTASIATQGHCFTGPNNESFHFFKSFTDSFHLMRTDENEKVNCSDTFFMPSTPSYFGYFDTSCYFDTLSAFATTEDIVPDMLTTSDFTISSTHFCDPLTNGVPYLTEENEVDIFPNPASSEINILNEKETAELVNIVNLEGRVMGTYQRTSKIDVEFLAPGTYLLRVVTKKSARVFKFTKQ
jgi:hypothetical protein